MESDYSVDRHRDTGASIHSVAARVAAASGVMSNGSNMGSLDFSDGEAGYERRRVERRAERDRAELAGSGTPESGAGSSGGHADRVPDVGVPSRLGGGEGASDPGPVSQTVEEPDASRSGAGDAAGAGVHDLRSHRIPQQVLLHDLYYASEGLKPGEPLNNSRVMRAIVEALIYLVRNTPASTRIGA
jgi:hypothetical protein